MDVGMVESILDHSAISSKRGVCEKLTYYRVIPNCRQSRILFAFETK